MNCTGMEPTAYQLCLIIALVLQQVSVRQSLKIQYAVGAFANAVLEFMMQYLQHVRRVHRVGHIFKVTATTTQVPHRTKMDIYFFVKVF